jgi:undecaprenyl-diphosphatase
MPDWLASILLGLIEGLTEFIPVSSTGHLLIAEDFMRERGILQSVLGDKAQKEIFTIIIQSAAALALVPLFWAKFSGMMFRFHEPANRDLLLKLSAAFMLTCVAGLVCKAMDLELPETAVPVAWATLIGGFVILAVERVSSRWNLTNRIAWPVVLAVAGGQILAMLFPGASRSGSTIMVALLMGLARPAATEFSFLLGVPTLLAAGAYEMLKAWKSGALAHMDWGLYALGFVTAGISAFVVVKWLIRFVQGHSFNGFAIYRIALGAALLLYAARA